MILEDSLSRYIGESVLGLKEGYQKFELLS
jgi:hypothetical protein